MGLSMQHSMSQHCVSRQMQFADLSKGKMQSIQIPWADVMNHSYQQQVGAQCYSGTVPKLSAFKKCLDLKSAFLLKRTLIFGLYASPSKACDSPHWQ